MGSWKFKIISVVCWFLRFPKFNVKNYRTLSLTKYTVFSFSRRKNLYYLASLQKEKHVWLAGQKIQYEELICRLIRAAL